MNAVEVLATCQAAGVSVEATERGTLRCHGTVALPPGLLSLIRSHKTAILRFIEEQPPRVSLLGMKANPAEPQATRRTPVPDPDFPQVTPDPAAEAAALAAGWTQRDDGRWRFPEAWQQIPALTPDPSPRPLTNAEKAQIRRGRAPLPPGVAYGQTPTGQWRRLS